MAISKDALAQIIAQKFPDATFEIVDLAGDGEHYELHIQSAQFQGLAPLKQHRLVYDALEGIVGGTLHALALKTQVKL